MNHHIQCTYSRIEQKKYLSYGIFYSHTYAHSIYVFHTISVHESRIVSFSPSSTNFPFYIYVCAVLPDGEIDKKKYNFFLNYALECVESDCVALKAQRMPVLIRDVQGRLIFHFFSHILFYILLSKINWCWCQQNFEAFFNNFFRIFFFSFFDEQKKHKLFVACKKYFFISLCLLIKNTLVYHVHIMYTICGIDINTHTIKLVYVAVSVQCVMVKHQNVIACHIMDLDSRPGNHD